MAISECMAYGYGGVCWCVKKNCGSGVVIGLNGWIYDNRNPEIYCGF